MRNEMIKKWKRQLDQPSGNLTTNERMPDDLKRKILVEDVSFKGKLDFKDVIFSKLSGILGKTNGMDILSGLQNIHKKNHLTLYRAVRFPTYKRLFEMVCSEGCAIANYEQERILELYKDKNYQTKRKNIKKDKHFWVVPQERVVPGLPMFSLVNDALQIHHAYRGKRDKVAMIVIHIPHNLLKNKIKLIANSAIDINYDEGERDYEIKDFVIRNGIVDFDYAVLRAKGIDLHELYAKNLPWCLKDFEKIGISQDFFLLDIEEISAKDKKKIKEISTDNELLKKNQYFLHGFFGDQNIFARRESRYLPIKCQKISIKEYGN